MDKLIEFSRNYSGREDIPLNEVGKKQASQCSCFTRRNVDIIISSPLIRAQETANEIAKTVDYNRFY